MKILHRIGHGGLIGGSGVGPAGRGELQRSLMTALEVEQTYVVNSGGWEIVRKKRIEVEPRAGVPLRRMAPDRKQEAIVAVDVERIIPGSWNLDRRSRVNDEVDRPWIVVGHRISRQVRKGHVPAEPVVVDISLNNLVIECLRKRRGVEARAGRIIQEVLSLRRIVDRRPCGCADAVDRKLPCPCRGTNGQKRQTDQTAKMHFHLATSGTIHHPYPSSANHNPRRQLMPTPIPDDWSVFDLSSQLTTCLRTNKLPIGNIPAMMLAI